MKYCLDLAELRKQQNSEKALPVISLTTVLQRATIMIKDLPDKKRLLIASGQDHGYHPALLESPMQS